MVISTKSEVLPKVLVSHAELIDATVKQPIVCNQDASGAKAAATSALSNGDQLGEVAVTEEASVRSIFRRQLI